MNRIPVLHHLRAALRHAWAQRQPREQQLLRLGAAVLLLAALWGLALAPALRTWQEAPAQQARLDQQTQRMRQLQAQAQTAQKPNPIQRSDALRWMETHLDDLGAGAKISLQGEHALLSLEAAPPEALAYWLTSAREQALALPVKAQLQQGAGPASSASAALPSNANAATPSSGNETLWRGTLLLRLP